MPSFRVLVVAKSAVRASNLLRLLIDTEKTIPLEHRAFFLFTTEETYLSHPTNILATVWRAADDPEELRGIIPSPLQRA